MAKVGLRAIEHKGEAYIHIEDLERYIESRAHGVANPVLKDVLYTLIYKLKEVRGGRPGVVAPR